MAKVLEYLWAFLVWLCDCSCKRMSDCISELLMVIEARVADSLACL